MRSQSLNGFSYVNGNPTNYIDSSGRCGGPFGGGSGDVEVVAFQACLEGGSGGSSAIALPSPSGGFRLPPISLPGVDPRALWAAIISVCAYYLTDERTQTDPRTQPQQRPTPTPIPPIPTSTPEAGKIYQFAERPGSQQFQNGPAEDDFDGISVALAERCGSPADCLFGMFRRPAEFNDYYRETTIFELEVRGFVITPNGDQPITGSRGGTYPFPHASVTHPNQTYRDNGSPQWSKGLKNQFKNSFSEAMLVLSP